MQRVHESCVTADLARRDLLKTGLLALTGASLVDALSSLSYSARFVRLAGDPHLKIDRIDLFQSICGDRRRYF